MYINSYLDGQWSILSKVYNNNWLLDDYHKTLNDILSQRIISNAILSNHCLGTILCLSFDSRHIQQTETMEIWQGCDRQNIKKS